MAHPRRKDDQRKPKQALKKNIKKKNEKKFEHSLRPGSRKKPVEGQEFGMEIDLVKPRPLKRPVGSKVRRPNQDGKRHVDSEPPAVRRKRKLDAMVQLQLPGGEGSKSQRRKLMKRIVTERRDPNFELKQSCNDCYQRLLFAGKDENAAVGPAAAEAAVKLVLPDDLNGVIPAADLERAVQKCDLQYVSRMLQMALKFGSPALRQKILQIVEKGMKTMMLSKYGHKICCKAFLHGDKNQRERLGNLLMHGSPLGKGDAAGAGYKPSKTFLSKYGANVWEYFYSKTVSQKLRKKILTTLFVPKFVTFELSTDMEKTNALAESWDTQSWQVLYQNMNDKAREGFRKNFFEAIVKAVDKELLSTEIVCAALRSYLMNVPPVEEELTKLAEITLEGASNLLSSKDGIEILGYLSGYWSAKSRKSFVKAVKSQCSLEKTSWHDVAKNELGSLLICRLLTTVDDTELLISQVLEPMLGMAINKGQAVVKARHRFAEALACTSVCRVLCCVFTGPERCMKRKLFNKWEYDLLTLPSPTSRKSNETRSSEIIDKYLGPLLKFECNRLSKLENGSGKGEEVVADQDAQADDKANETDVPDDAEEDMFDSRDGIELSSGDEDIEESQEQTSGAQMLRFSYKGDDDSGKSAPVECLRDLVCREQCTRELMYGYVIRCGEWGFVDSVLGSNLELAAKQGLFDEVGHVLFVDLLKYVGDSPETRIESARGFITTLNTFIREMLRDLKLCTSVWLNTRFAFLVLEVYKLGCKTTETQSMIRKLFKFVHSKMEKDVGEISQCVKLATSLLQKVLGEE